MGYQPLGGSNQPDAVGLACWPRALPEGLFPRQHASTCASTLPTAELHVPSAHNLARQGEGGAGAATHRRPKASPRHPAGWALNSGRLSLWLLVRAHGIHERSCRMPWKGAPALWDSFRPLLHVLQQQLPYPTHCCSGTLVLLQMLLLRGSKTLCVLNSCMPGPA